MQKEDLKIFQDLDRKHSMSLSQLCSDQKMWWTMIHKEARIFQKEWENVRLQKK